MLRFFQAAGELEARRRGDSADPRKAAALRFTQAVARQRGALSDEEFERVRAAGWSDAEIVDILATVAPTTFTNLLAIAARIEVDFPLVEAGEAIAA
jgi:alkylhydroperoxidase family enzyme